ncbi:MAG: hypothetical protein ACYCO9_07140 [Streptosporangiaceae bacterium]
MGIEAVFSPACGSRPMFVTVTQTAAAADRHTDVSLWFILSHSTSEP